MAVKFTREQQEAIDLHGCNILVSAAAERPPCWRNVL